MSNNSNIATNNRSAEISYTWLEDLSMLFKTKLSLLVLFSAVMAYLIVAPTVSVVSIFLLCFGGFAITAASNTLNQVLERDFDKLMKRTQDRPLATGRMTVSNAVLIAGFLSLVGTTLLAFLNVWASLLGMISLIIYAFIYTPLKRTTPLSVWIGAIPGALPMAIGVVAAQGELTPLAFLLFGIQFFWQFPHFWSIAWLGHDDYSNAGYKMLPSKSGLPDEEVGFQSFIYALFLLPVFVTMLYLGAVGAFGFVVSLLLTIGYIWYAWNMYIENTKESAKKLMFSSFAYLPFVLIFLFIDKIIM